MNKLPKIYCDMDGVLCDFKTQASKATGMSIQDWMKEPGRKFKSIRDKWKPIKNYPNFWASMPWETGGKELWNYIKRFNPEILSAYVEQTTDPSCIPGKTKWARTNLGFTPKLNLVKRVEKQKYAKDGRNPTVLIDDYEKNIRQFNSAGGIGILHTSTSNTISQLKKLGYK